MKFNSKTLKKFRAKIWRFYRRHGRNFPWRKTHNPYHILISEIMLQQTQVNRALIKYPLFLKQFPSIADLADAPFFKVLQVWQGLGYNRRALMLKRCAEQIHMRYDDKLPKDPALLKMLPGIGPSTAGAIAAFAHNFPYPFIETNIRRVFLHFFFPKQTRITDKKILPLVMKTTDRKNPREWFWALMDYGAMLGKQKENANRRSSAHKTQSAFHGSRRELRGKILQILLQKGACVPAALAKKTERTIFETLQALTAMKKEGLVIKKRRRFYLAR